MKHGSIFGKATYLGVLSCLLIPMYAHSATIEVTTTQDQNGEDSSSCSIREAVKTAMDRREFGGCEFEGSTQSGVVDVVKLDKQTYTLNSQISVNRGTNSRVSRVIIRGPSGFDYTMRNPITGSLGKPELHLATVRSASGRVFDTTQDRLSLQLENLVVEGSGQTLSKGGIFNIGGELSLVDVVVKGGSAQTGGAIFLDGEESALNLYASSFIENTAIQNGAVLAMTCTNGLAPVIRTITIEASSFANNTANNGSILNFCGNPEVTLENSSVVKNTSGTAAIDFVDLALLFDDQEVLIPILELSRTTLAGNTGGLRYSEIGLFLTGGSVVAFNDGFDCKFSPVDTAVTLDDASVQVEKTLLAGAANTRPSNACQLPALGTDQTDNNEYVGAQPLTQFYESDQLFNVGLDLFSYVPKLLSEAPELALTDNDCKNADMRGISRDLKGLDNRLSSSCYKGSVERGNLVAVDDTPAIKNDSFIAVLESIDQAIDQDTDDFEDDVLELALQQIEYNKAYKEAYVDLKSNHFRAAVSDVLLNDVAYETSSAQIQLLPLLRGLDSNGNAVVDGAENYIITASALGTTAELTFDSNGVLEEDSYEPQPALVCEYNESLGQLTAWRTDFSVSNTGEYDVCSYQIESVTSGQVSTGYASVIFENQAPVARDFIVEVNGDESRVNILFSGSVDDDGYKISGDQKLIISDLGDGPQFYTAGSGLSVQDQFYKTPEGASAFIEFTQLPTAGKIVFTSPGFDCPNENPNQASTGVCYPADFGYYVPSGGQFDDSITYRIYDAGVSPGSDAAIRGSKVSEPATIFIKSARPSAHADLIVEGGGSMNWYWLLALTGLLAIRRRAS